MAIDMTPDKYIEQLKKEHPNTPVDQRRLSDISMNAVREGRTTIAEINEEDMIDYGKFLLGYLDERLPEEIKAIIKNKIIVVGSVNDQLPKVELVETTKACFAIPFNNGLKNFLYRIIRAFCTRINIGNVSVSSLSFEETVQVIDDILWWYGTTKQAAGPDYRISERGATFASMLTMEAESFLLLHEIGRAINTVRDTAYEMRKKDKTDNILFADNFAISVLITSTKHCPQDVSYAGAEMALHIFKVLEMLNLPCPSENSNAIIRLENLRERITLVCKTDREFKQVTDISSANDILLTKIFNMITTGSDGYKDFYKKEASRNIEELNALLKQCEGFLPDHMTFRTSALRIFSNGFSKKLLAEVEKIGKEKDYTKFKLLMGYFEGLYEPMGSLFRDALVKEIKKEG